jgi:hypothetical protein
MSEPGILLSIDEDKEASGRSVMASIETAVVVASARLSLVVEAAARQPTWTSLSELEARVESDQRAAMTIASIGRNERQISSKMCVAIPRLLSGVPLFWTASNTPERPRCQTRWRS